MKESDMACPIDGTAYVTVGNQRVCPKCGHVAGYKQIDIVQILRENEELKQKNKELLEIIQEQNGLLERMGLAPSPYNCDEKLPQT